MTTTQTPSTLLALHDADPAGLQIIAAELNKFTSVTPCGQYGHRGDLCEPYMRCLLPKWSTSLDAVAELEAGLTDEEHKRFRQHLWEVATPARRSCSVWNDDGQHCRAYASAKPHLRLIAWVLTKQTI